MPVDCVIAFAVGLRLKRNMSLELRAKSLEQEALSEDGVWGETTRFCSEL